VQAHNSLSIYFTQNDINRIHALLDAQNSIDKAPSSNDIRLLNVFLNSFTHKIEKALKGTQKGGFFSSFHFMCKFLEKIKHFKHIITLSSATAVIITSIAIAVGGIGSVILGAIASVIAGVGALFYLGFIVRKLYKRKFSKNEEILQSILIKAENGKCNIKEFNFLSSEERYSSTAYLNLYQSISKLCLNQSANNLPINNSQINIQNILDNQNHISYLLQSKVSKVFGVKKAKTEIILSCRF
jgi:hypothetical protein